MLQMDVEHNSNMALALAMVMHITHVYTLALAMALHITYVVHIGICQGHTHIACCIVGTCHGHAHYACITNGMPHITQIWQIWTLCKRQRGNGILSSEFTLGVLFSSLLLCRVQGEVKCTSLLFRGNDDVVLWLL